MDIKKSTLIELARGQGRSLPSGTLRIPTLEELKPGTTLHYLCWMVSRAADGTTDVQEGASEPIRGTLPIKTLDGNQVVVPMGNTIRVLEIGRLLSATETISLRPEIIAFYVVVEEELLAASA